MTHLACGIARIINLIAAQQVALDNALVAPENRVQIGKCNMRIDPTKTPKEPTYQVVLDALALTTLYHVFLITAEVPKIYMQQFWHTITKGVKGSSLYQFKLPNQEFVVPPSSDLEIVSFIKELGYTDDIDYVTKVYTDHMHQPWRTFSAVINRCLSGKTTGLDKIRLSRAQILWKMYYNQNIDFVELLWEDFMFQIDNRDSKKQEKMYYPRFTKAIIQHFISKDKSISMRNRLFMHTIQDDSILGSLRFVSKTKEYQVYGALIHAGMTNRNMLNSTAYNTYLAFAIGAATPKKARKFKKPASPSKKKTLIAVEEPTENSAKKPATRRQSAGVQIRDTPGVSVSKKKAPAKTERSKGIKLLSKAVILEEA
ncbi:hypothetical protein Tco_0926974 [Tanacetum coccineum]|uniref:Uncharacterized protein n=1 Tax=Tanacetum coccineum TaxID=301880 RepID=A0ABQ5DBE0_9ASTR